MLLTWQAHRCILTGSYGQARVFFSGISDCARGMFLFMCRWYVADGRADGLEEASTSGRELRGGAARIGRPEELFGSSQKRKRPARHRVIMLRGVVRTSLVKEQCCGNIVLRAHISLMED